MKVILLILFLFMGFRSIAQTITPAKGDRFYYHFNGKEYCDVGQPLKITICEFRDSRSNTVWVQNHSMSAKDFNRLRTFIGDDKTFNSTNGASDNFFVYQVTGGVAVMGTPIDVHLLQKRVKEFFTK